MSYEPIHKKYVSPSEATNKLLKRKRILENFGGTAEEWLVLADDFLADGCRLNHAYCMSEFRHLTENNDAPTAFEYEIPPEPEVPVNDSMLEVEYESIRPN